MTAALHTDDQLMSLFKSGDDHAFATLHGRWNARLFGFLVRRLGCARTAEDVLQETWIRICRHRSRYQDGRSVAPWLFTIAQNTCYSHARRSVRLQPMEQVPAVAVQATSALRCQLEEVIGAVDDEHRELMLLAAQGFSSSEIAVKLSMRPSGVRMRLMRQRAALVEAMGGVAA